LSIEEKEFFSVWELQTLKTLDYATGTTHPLTRSLRRNALRYKPLNQC
jgi:hypothetical protein